MAKQGVTFKTILGIIILVTIIAAATSYGVISLFSSSEDIQVDRQGPELGPTYSLGEFTVNLSASAYQFIRASIVAEVSDSSVVAEIEKRNPQIRDIIITTLRSQNIADIEEPGAELIKNQIKIKVNKVLNTGQITNIWFTQLVVQ